MKKKTHPIPDLNSEALKEFRQAGSELLVKAKDATFELTIARNAACLAKFSLSPAFEKWDGKFLTVMSGTGTLPLINIAPPQN